MTHQTALIFPLPPPENVYRFQLTTSNIVSRMATIAHSAPGPGITTASDAMDLHSDNGYDLGDGDIDLEFESSTAGYHQDDNDLLLQDAAPDPGLDLHTTLPDQDDFMADKDDLIEEDEIDYGDVEVVDARQPSPDNPTIIQEITIEEDLIDYSDEEDGPSNVTHEASPHVEETSATQDTSVDPTHSQPGFEPDEAEALHQSAEERLNYDYHEEEHGYEPEFVHDATQSWDTTGTDWEQHTTGEYSTDLPANDQDEHQQQQEEVQAQTGEEFVDQPTPSDRLVTADGITKTQQDILVEQHDHVDEQLQAHQVTVNYDGAEFWLFRPSETEDNEDWLLSDRLIQGKLLNELFQACRVALRNDINQDTEIGFRFDHFHNLEIYEDSTACLFVKLQDLVDIYLKLHAQDGTSNPESFYITLQFRPRVSTLLGELNKAVRDRVGYSGLNTAVAAGQTAFNTPYSNNEQTDDAYENWEEEQELEHNDEAVQPGEQYEDVEEAVSLEISSHENRQNAQDLEHHNPIAPHSIAGNHNVPSEGAGLVTNLQDETDTASNIQTPLKKQSVEEKGGAIGYSDEERAADAVQTDQVGQASAHISVHDPSSGSSTVQGDNDSRQEDYTNPESNEDVEQPANNNEEGSEIDHGDEEAHTEFDAEFASYDNDGLALQAYDDEAFNQEFEQDYDEDGTGQPYGTEEYETQQSYAADDSYYDDEVGTNPHEELNFPSAVEDNSNFDDGSNQIVDDENFADVDGTFDFPGDETTTTNVTDHASLQDGTNNAIDENYINYEDDEDGTVEQPTVATSAAAQPPAALSSGLDHAGSPQGLKRSIDEVGNGLDVGTDLSGSLSPFTRLARHQRKFCTDAFYPDAKRPRV